MNPRISKSRADRVGDRLRRAESPDPADLAELQEIIAEYDEPLAKAQSVLRAAGFSATSRLKTELTTLEKLKREKNRLSTIQDIAGLRIVIDMNLDEQDRVTERIVDLFEGPRVLDRRENPSFGYRAMHVVAQVDGFPVEIQVRTSFQDLWAQAFERFADLVGRGIRYGDVLEEPVSEQARRGFARISTGIATLEAKEAEMHRLEVDVDSLVAMVHPSGFDFRSRLRYLVIRHRTRKLNSLKATLSKRRAALLQSMQELVDLFNEA